MAIKIKIKSSVISLLLNLNFVEFYLLKDGKILVKQCVELLL